MYVPFVFDHLLLCETAILISICYRLLSSADPPKEPKRTMNPTLIVIRLLICWRRRTFLGRRIRKIILVAATKRWTLITMLASTIPSCPSRTFKRTRSVVPRSSAQRNSIRILTMTTYPNTSFIRLM